MPKVNCSVTGCSDSTHKLIKWKKETCTEHNIIQGNCKNKGDCLESKRPFHLYTCPCLVKCKDLREV